VLVCLFPTILTALVAFLSFSPFIFGVLHISLGRLVLIGLLACLVGVTEESLFRGLVLQTLLPKGVLRALLLSSLIFALLHVGNLFAGLFWGYVVEQVLFAFAIGLAFAVMRVRTGSIWPGIILHSLNDFAALTLISVTGIPHPMLAGGLIAGGIWCLMYGIYAAIALRPSKLRELTWAGANP
jgi:membrane protease YdiL (CAAX protease family)